MHEVPPNLPTPDSEWATPDETRAAINCLGKTEHAKLALISRAFSRQRLRGDVIEPKDLLHDAITKTLDGRRHWNKNVSLIQHLDRTMESDSGHIAAQRKRTNIQSLTDEHGALTAARSPESANSETLNDLFRIFQDDEPACTILHQKAEGRTPTEIRETLRITTTQYDTIMKRIRRRLVQTLLSTEHTTKP